MSEYTRVIATYVGQRISTKGKLCYAWKIDGKVWCYAKQLIWAKVGEIFDFAQSETGSFYIRGEHAPVKIGEDENAAKWETEQAAARIEHQERKAEDKLKARKSELEQAIEPLKRFLEACPSHMERGAVIALITRELWRK